ncbi:hypothetical protein I6F37_40855, partial [Bradyrhizobium sp. NBAIM08]|nr:hypothetical protein [Bradyrhizobium sp. NBAIM08]
DMDKLPVEYVVRERLAPAQITARAQHEDFRRIVEGMSPAPSHRAAAAPQIRSTRLMITTQRRGTMVASCRLLEYPALRRGASRLAQKGVGKGVGDEAFPLLGAPSPVGEDEVLRLAASAEGSSEHPLAQAVVDAAKERQLTL